MASTISQVNICNQALIFLGEKTIIALDDETRQGELCSTFFDNTRDTMLRMHPWNFAIKRKALTLDTNTPLYEWDKQFILPGDYLRVINTSPIGIDYVVEGNRILTDESELSIKYIFRNVDYGSWSPEFAQLVAARLAVQLVHTITDKSALIPAVTDWYRLQENMARGVESQEGSPETINSDDLIDARYMGTSARFVKDIFTNH